MSVLDARRFGCRPDGVSDNTAAIGAACAQLQAMGGGLLQFPAGGGPYNLAGIPDRPVATLRNLRGVTIECLNGAMLRDTASYSGLQQGDLFSFEACSDIALRLRVSSTPTVSPAFRNSRGLWIASFFRGCQDISLDLDLLGGLGGVRLEKLPGDPQSYVSRGIRGRIRATGTFYPLNSKYSGDDAELELDVEMCGRNFFIYGVKSQRLTVFSRNQQVTSLIASYQGYGCEDVDVQITDVESTVGQRAAPHLSICWRDQMEATHRNLRLRLNIRNASTPFANPVIFDKLNNNDGPDSVGRGHVLDGLDVSGIVDTRGAPGVNHFGVPSGVSFAPPDAMRRVRFHDLRCTGGGNLDVRLEVLQDIAIFDNVRVDGGSIYTLNRMNGLVRFVRSAARNFTATQDSTDNHEYYESEITLGNSQNYVNNKKFYGTALPDLSK